MATDKILVVDDEPEIHEFISKILSCDGFDVVTASNGLACLEMAKKEDFSVVIVDLKMPGISGEETLKLLKQEHKWMEVVILTGHGAVDSAVECTKSGAYSYLQKPCELNQLLEALQDAYKKKVMNRKQIEEKKMNELLSISISSRPREILRKLRELDK